LGYDSNGKLGVGYLNWTSEIGSVDMNVNGASSLGNLSDWNFNRLTVTGDLSASKKMFRLKQRIIVGKIWTDAKGVPGQEGYNIEGNSSNDMVRKNYLVDQFYGFELQEGESLINHYHMPGEGNLRGFVGKGERGAEALAAFSSEASISRSIKKLNFNIEFAAFADGGLFWDRLDETSNVIGSTFISRTLADAGLGLRLKTDIFEKDLFLRIDLPFIIHNNGASSFDNYENWIISFQRSI
jgi:hypothetical protein